MQTDGSPAAPSGVQVCVEPIQPPWQLPDPTVLPWHTPPPARQPPVTAGPSQQKPELHVQQISAGASYAQTTLRSGQAGPLEA